MARELGWEKDIINTISYCTKHMELSDETLAKYVNTISNKAVLS